MRSQNIVEFGSPLQALETVTPEPQGTQVLLRVHHCGVCHSDVHIQDGHFDLGGGKKLALANIKLPHVMGHEIEGEVVALGPDARGVNIGDRRAAFPWIGCGECGICARGDEHLCARPRQLGVSSETPGGFATHVLVPHPRYLIDYSGASATLGATSMCSGLTAYSALRKAGTPGPADPVVVLGCGGVGMMGIQFAQAMFGRGPIAADVDARRLEAALAAGASAAVDTTQPDAGKKFLKETGGAWTVVDFVGSESSFAFANQVVRKGGRVVVVGLFGGAMSMPLPMFPLRAISIGGSYVGTLAEANEMMALIRAGQVAPIPYQFRPLDDASRSLDDLRAGRVVGRIVLQP
ncbi:MAG: alcohol dehydrogenase catalytic domain-containing protein [Gammaproteobacteria bacterium]